MAIGIMHSKEWHSYRIDELSFMREDNAHIRRSIPSFMIGIAALFLTMLAIYFPTREKYTLQILGGGCLTLILVFALLWVENRIKVKDRLILTQIRHNYDVLLGRNKDR